MKPKRKMKGCSWIYHLEREFRKLSAIEAVDMLVDEFKFGSSTVRFLSGNAYSIEGVRDTIKGHTVDAESVGPLYFWGGPPDTMARQYTGTLLTVLMDRVMFQHTVNGSYADLISK